VSSGTSTQLTISEFRNKHLGERCVVAGIGPTIRETLRPEVVCIGVNDVERYWRVDYLLTVDPPGRFDFKRRAYLEKSIAPLFVGQPHCGRYPRENTVDYLLKEPRGLAGLPDETGRLLYHKDSPYIAVSLACWMGFTEIGLIGVDHTGDHCRIGKLASTIRYKYAEQAAVLKGHGIRLVKLAVESSLPINYVPYAEWNNGGSSHKPADSNVSAIPKVGDESPHD